MKVVEMIGSRKAYPRVTICDWSEDYPSLAGKYTMNLYARSRETIPGRFSPNLDEGYLFMFDFETLEEAREAGKRIVNHGRSPLDYVSQMEKPEYARCLW